MTAFAGRPSGRPSLEEIEIAILPNLFGLEAVIV